MLGDQPRSAVPIPRPLVDRAEGKAILVGDPRQLPPVGAGGLYPALCERLGAISLVENRRQRDLSEREALVRLREGDAEAYLVHAARHGRLHLDRDPTDAKQRLLEDWWQVAQHDLAGSVMLAYRRADVRELNDAARAVLTRAGRLGPDVLEIGECEFRIGDRVLCRRNDRVLGVRDGMQATVVGLDQRAITLRTDNGALRTVGLRYASEHLEHGYALTGHAAQGATVERAFVLLPDRGALREWGYVACTRARAETHLYLAERDAIERESPLRAPERAPPAERVARALERSAPKRSRSTVRQGTVTRPRGSLPGNESNSSGNAPGQPSNSPPPNASSSTSAGGTAAAGASSSKPRSPSTRRRSGSPTRGAHNWN